VGISSDFDGGGGVDGWRNASESLNVTAELVRRGYSKSEIEKIWGGNLLRVMSEVEKAAEKKGRKKGTESTESTSSSTWRRSSAEGRPKGDRKA
jgi:hypothetical protein